jgi:hypothetical protein
MASAAKPYDRRHGEPMKWFARFQLYLDAGSDRTLLGVYKSQRNPAEISGRKNVRVPGSWDTAFTRWEWQNRADAFDADQLAIRRLEADKTFKEELRKHQANAKNLAGVALGSAVKLLKLTHQKLDRMNADDIDPSSLASYLRAAAAVAEAGLNGEAVALGTAEILQSLDHP